MQSSQNVKGPQQVGLRKTNCFPATHTWLGYSLKRATQVQEPQRTLCKTLQASAAASGKCWQAER